MAGALMHLLIPDVSRSAACRLSSELIRIHPNRVLAWGLDSDAFAQPLARNVEHG
jgi:hypothetical protein